MLRVILPLLSVVAVQGQVAVTTYRNDLDRSGANTAEKILTPANVNPARFGKLFSGQLTARSQRNRSICRW